MDFDFEFDLEDIEEETSNYRENNNVEYLKVERKLEDNQEFFVTHLEIREKTGNFGAGNRETSNLLDSICRNNNGVLPKYKVEKRVEYMNNSLKKDFFIVEVGMIINLID